MEFSTNSFQVSLCVKKINLARQQVVINKCIYAHKKCMPTPPMELNLDLF